MKFLKDLNIIEPDQQKKIVFAFYTNTFNKQFNKEKNMPVNAVQNVSFASRKANKNDNAKEGKHDK